MLNAKKIIMTVAIFLMASPYVLAAPITLTQVNTTFNKPIGIDYHEPTNSLVLSANYPTGSPNNFERIDVNGNNLPFSSISGLTDEIKIATVRSGGVGGFVTGDLFTGNGIDGEIARITNNGATIINPFVSLPGAGNGLMRGSLYIDRTGVYGGDLIAATTGGEVWRVDSSGNPTKIADVNVHLEGLITVPNDVSKYGTLAGKIIAGAEGEGRLYIFDNNGFVDNPLIGVNIEDIDLIQANENFFGVNFGTNSILGATASNFSGFAGDILLTQEFGGGSGLTRLYWDGTSLQTEAFTLAANSFNPGQWEHVTFAPTGIANVPEPGTFALVGSGLVGLFFLRKRRGKKV